MEYIGVIEIFGVEIPQYLKFGVLSGAESLTNRLVLRVFIIGKETPFPNFKATHLGGGFGQIL